MGSLWAKITYLKSHSKALAFSLQTDIWNISFIWSTKHWFWSRGGKDIRGQSWRSKKISADSADPGCIGSNRAESADIFFYLQLWPLMSLQPLDQNQCLVLHLKDYFISVWRPKTKAFKWLLRYIQTNKLLLQNQGHIYLLHFVRLICSLCSNFLLLPF